MKLLAVTLFSVGLGVGGAAAYKSGTGSKALASAPLVGSCARLKATCAGFTDPADAVNALFCTKISTKIATMAFSGREATPEFCGEMLTVMDRAKQVGWPQASAELQSRMATR